MVQSYGYFFVFIQTKKLKSWWQWAHHNTTIDYKEWTSLFELLGQPKYMYHINGHATSHYA